MTMRRLAFALILGLGLLDAIPPAAASEPAKLRVNVFAGVQNLPIFAGLAKGIFGRHGLDIELQFTPNSPAQREGLAKGAIEIAHAAADNSVALADTGAGSIIVMGGDSSLQELFAQPEIKSAADLNGRTVIVDAPNTAYALVVKKALRNAGLRDGQDYTLKPTGGTFVRLGLMKENKEHAATMLNPPFSIMATREGFPSVGMAIKLVGPYQGSVCFVLRSWAEANVATLER
jgi:ABC-type nitrate/sulfonate/bicarbonate transport system substrate-binding protein